MLSKAYLPGKIDQMYALRPYSSAKSALNASVNAASTSAALIAISSSAEEDMAMSAADVEAALTEALSADLAEE